MKSTPAPQTLAFKSELTRLAPGINYFALPVPEKVSRALGTPGPVPVSARINGATAFLVSLYPLGGGRHNLRVKAKVREEAKISEGDIVRVEITVIDRAQVAIPEDLEHALLTDGALTAFKSLPPGKRNYTIRVIDQAARPETRAKRIQEAVKAVRAIKSSD